MDIAVVTPKSHYRAWASRLRYNLGGAMLLACVVPHLARLFFDVGSDISNLYVTTMACAVAIAIGQYVLRSVSVYPGVDVTRFVVPAMLLSYGSVAVGLLIGRLDYARGNLLASFLICIAWYLIVHLLRGRRTPLCIGVVPFGHALELVNIPSINWQVMLSKDQSPAFDAIVADLRADIPAEWEAAIADWVLDGHIIYHSKNLMESITGKVRVDHLGENTFGTLMPIDYYMKLKIVIDVLTATVFIPLISPVLMAIWLIMKVVDPGPFLFRQVRVGYRGRKFVVFKIRTMKPDQSIVGDCMRQNAITLEGDPRVTRFGRFLRRSRIDELPQIFNILRGEMSWIGPRPEAAALSEWYASEIPYYAYRHVVRPGITGWAQVNQGHVAKVDQVHEKLQNDFYYIKNFSIWLDILIVVMTVRTVLTGFGAR